MRFSENLVLRFSGLGAGLSSQIYTVLRIPLLSYQFFSPHIIQFLTFTLKFILIAYFRCNFESQYKFHFPTHFYSTTFKFTSPISLYNSISYLTTLTSQLLFFLLRSLNQLIFAIVKVDTFVMHISFLQSISCLNHFWNRIIS